MPHSFLSLPFFGEIAHFRIFYCPVFQQKYCLSIACDTASHSANVCCMKVVLSGWFVVLALCCCALPVGGHAQTPVLPVRIGGALYGGQNVYSADFHNIEGVPISDKADNFTEGNGFAYGIAGVYEFPLFDNVFIGARLGLQYLGGALHTQEGPVTSDVGDVVLEHTINASIFSAMGEPSIGVQLGNHWSVYGGVRLGWVASALFEQSEAIVQPLGTEYVQGGSSRSIANLQAIPNAPSLEVALVGRVGYSVPLSSVLLLQPEVSFHVGMTEMSAATGWKVATIHGGVALLWQPTPDKPLYIDTVYQRDTTVQVLAGITREEVVESSVSASVEQSEAEREIRRTVILHQHYIRKIPRPRPLLNADLGVRFVLNNGQESEGVHVTIQKIVEQKYIPLLPYVFFDSVSAVLPNRYNHIAATDAEHFVPQVGSENDVLSTYYNVLNIVGMRMRQYPDAILSITGTHSGDKVEAGAPSLSLRRAESIRSYLADVWSIEPQRLQVRSTGIPEHPSNELLSEGSEENRRAELSADNPVILAPLHVVDTVRVANPPIVRFYPACFSEAGVDAWHIHIFQGKRILKSFHGEGMVPASVDWNIDSDKAVLVSADAPMEYKLVVRDNEQQEAETSQGSIVFQVQEHNAHEAEKGTVQRYSLIVFDYDGISVTKQHRAILTTVQSNLPERSDVAVVGMTDVLGDSEYNKQLSLRRAQAIVAALKLPDATAVGIGEQSAIPATTPEGRFYSRRVDIIVRTRSAQ